MFEKIMLRAIWGTIDYKGPCRIGYERELYGLFQEGNRTNSKKLLFGTTGSKRSIGNPRCPDAVWEDAVELLRTWNWRRETMDARVWK